MDFLLGFYWDNGKENGNWDVSNKLTLGVVWELFRVDADFMSPKA